MADPVFNLTIDDTSPVVTYHPAADTFSAPNTALSWNPFYTDSGFATINSGAGSAIGPAIGNGTSLHLTACDGATVQIDWNGTDITLFGTLVPLPSNGDSDTPDPSYSIVLDGTATTNYIWTRTDNPTVQSAAEDILASFSNLEDGPHSLQLVFRNPSDDDSAGNSTAGPIIVFDRAVVTVGTAMSNTNPSTSPPTSTAAATPSPTETASTAPVPDGEVAFRGQWDFESALLPGSSATFHTSTNAGDRAMLVFNGSAVGLTGLTTPASGTYSVSLDQEQPLIFSARSSFTASSPTVLFFRSGLDPSVMHTLEVVNTGASRAGEGAGSLLVLAAVNVTDAQNPAATPIGAAKGPSLPRGAIAALAIGVILALGALVAVIVVFVRRRHRNASRKRQMLVNPQIHRARRLSFLFPHKRRSEPGEPIEHDTQKARESAYAAGGVLDIRSPIPHTHEKDESDDSDDGEDVEAAPRLSAAEKGKQRALRQSNASKNSDGSYSIELPDLTIAQVPRGYLPASAVPSTPSPPRTLTLNPSPTATSPRSPVKPRGPRDLPGRESTRGILMTNLGTLPAPAFADEEGQLITTPPSYLPEAQISPLRVEFASDVQDRIGNGNGGERSVSMGAMSLPQSLKLALAQQGASESSVSAPPSPTRASRIYSFLDFSSTSTSLARSQRQSASNSTGKSRSSSRSKRTTGSEHSHRGEDRRESRGVDWATLPPDRRISLGLSMTLAGGGTTSRPSLSPNISLHPIPLSQSAPALPALRIGEATPPPQESPEREGPDQDFPYDANQLPSPTDSVPYTVSDIHFRHSTHSSISPIESRRTSAYRLSGSHRPPHPPLPNSAGPSTPTRSTRPGHRRGNSQAGSQSVPPFIVQRILGRAPGSVPGSTYASPTTPQFASVGSVTGAAMAMRAQTPTPTPTPRAASGQPSAGAQSTPAPTNASTSSVFGFQLGRHR